jgi:hypothetical protein
MVGHESTGGDKKSYGIPRLTSLGTLKDITLMRFNWQGGREWRQDPIGNVS